VCIKAYGGVIYVFEGAQTVFARAIGHDFPAGVEDRLVHMSTGACMGLFLPE